MAPTSDEQRIKRELSQRGACSLLDLKSALKLPKGHISPITDRLAHLGLVRIEKDHLDSHHSYTWIGPKEEAKPPDAARPKRVKGKRTAPPGAPLEGRASAGREMAEHRRSEERRENWRKISAQVLQRIRAKNVDGSPVYPLPYEWRNHAIMFLRDPRMEKAYDRILHLAAKDGKEAIPVFTKALWCGLVFNPTKKKLDLFGTGVTPLADAKKVRVLRDKAEKLVQFFREIPLCQSRSGSWLWYRAFSEWTDKELGGYPVGTISDAHVIDALQVVRDFLSAYIPPPRRRGRPIERDQNYLMLRLESLFKKQFGRPHHAIIALFIETVCGGSMTATEVKTSLGRLRNRNKA